METAEDMPPSSASQDKTDDTSQEQDGDSVFLTPSQDTASQQLLPDIETQHLIRQKRRRTRQETPIKSLNDLCLLIDIAAPKTTQSSKRNMSEIPNPIRPQEWK